MLYTKFGGLDIQHGTA